MKPGDLSRTRLTFHVFITLSALILYGCSTAPAPRATLPTETEGLPMATPTQPTSTATLTTTPAPSPTATTTPTRTAQPTPSLTPTPGWFSKGWEIAYSALVVDDPARFISHPEVLTLQLNGSQPVKLIEKSEHTWNPQWSPDGQRIAVLSLDTYPPSLYIRDLETNQMDEIKDVRNFVWSNDGKSLVYCAAGNWLSGDIENFPCYWVETNDLSHPRLLFVPEWRTTELHWSPTDDRILAVGAREVGTDLGVHIYIFDLKGQVQEIPTQKQPWRSVTWHPSGEKIAYAPYPSSFMRPSQIRELDLLSLEERELTDIDRIASDPQWSPDGKYLAYEGQRIVKLDFVPPPGEDILIYILNLETGQTIQVPGSRKNMVHPTWSPDGKYLAFLQWSGDENKGFSLNIYEPATDKTVMLGYTSVFGYGNNPPAWRPLP